MKFNIIFNKNIDNYTEVLANIESYLIEKNVDFKSFDLDNLDNYGNFSMVIGGDGTLIKAAKFYAKTNIPVLGVNLGRLGFLSQSQPESIKSLIDSILQKNFRTEERLILQSTNLNALNDFVIKGCDKSRTSKFYLEINGETVCDYIADGLIISTPTGSTAYGLSAGGPVLHPTLDCIVIVPICPHTLNARPLVIPAKETISIKTGDKLLSVSVDGKEAQQCINKITISASKEKALLAFISSGNFYNVLRDKLHWGTSEAK